MLSSKRKAGPLSSRNGRGFPDCLRCRLTDGTTNSLFNAKENERKPGFDVNLITIEQLFAEQRCNI